MKGMLMIRSRKEDKKTRSRLKFVLLPNFLFDFFLSFFFSEKILGKLVLFRFISTYIFTRRIHNRIIVLRHARIVCRCDA